MFRKIKPDKDEDSQHEDYLPVTYKNGRMTCVCNYELIQQDDNSYRCTGGSHVYNLENGDVAYDKYGNLLLRTPENIN